mgnify:FL=1
MDCGGKGHEQEYELIYPARLAYDFDADELPAEECIGWLTDYDFDDDVKHLRKTMPRPPLPGVAAEDLDGMIGQLTLVDGVAWLREFAADEHEDLIEQCDTPAYLGLENLTGQVREAVVSSYDQLFDSWQDICHEVVIDNMDTAREQFTESNEPVMNYYYPISGGIDPEMVDKLSRTSLVAVKLQPQEEDVLVLGGGGMDLSWDIALAHILCGYYPPARMDLPDFAGTMLDAMRRTIIAACRESVLVQRSWANNRLERLTRNAKYMIKE